MLLIISENDWGVQSGTHHQVGVPATENPPVVGLSQVGALRIGGLGRGGDQLGSSVRPVVECPETARVRLPAKHDGYQDHRSPGLMPSGLVQISLR